MRGESIARRDDDDAFESDHTLTTKKKPKFMSINLSCKPTITRLTEVAIKVREK